MITFRNFLRNHDISFSLREQEAAPSMGGTGAQPSNPDSNFDSDTGYENVPNSMAREFNVPPEAMLAAIQTGTLTLHEIPNKEAEWGFTVRPPVDVTVQQINDNMYDVTFPFEMLYRQNPQLFMSTKLMPGNVVQYEGPIEDKTIQMSMNELMRAWQKSLEGAGSGGGMMGAPPMGGMGGPPMGGPPMGGM